MPAQRPPDGDGKKAEYLWTRLRNEKLTAEKTSRIRYGRWDWNPRKTQQGMARRYQGVVPAVLGSNKLQVTKLQQQITFLSNK